MMFTPYDAAVEHDLYEAAVHIQPNKAHALKYAELKPTRLKPNRKASHAIEASGVANTANMIDESLAT